MTERTLVKFAVHLILFRPGEEFLMMRRDNTGYFDGSWGIPAGHVELGESALEAMIREAKEEIGIDVGESNLGLCKTVHHLKPGNSVDYIHLFFGAHEWLGEPKNCEPDKCSEIAWFKTRPDNTIPYIGMVLDTGGNFNIFSGA